MTVVLRIGQSKIAYLNRKWEPRREDEGRKWQRSGLLYFAKERTSLRIRCT